MNIADICVVDIIVSAAIKVADMETTSVLTESIKLRGLINPITVRLKGNQYHLIDGRCRLEAYKRLGLATISANVIETAELESQLICSHHRIRTKPVEYARQLKKLLENNPMPLPELTEKLGKSVAWISNRLRLNKLHPAIAGLVDAELLPLVIAYKLSRLSQQEQCKFVYDKLTKE